MRSVCQVGERRIIEPSPIGQLNKGLQRFLEDLQAQDDTAVSVEVGVITSGSSAELVLPFTTPENISGIGPFKAWGGSPLGTAVNQALKMLEERKQEYKGNGVSYYQPWLVIICDGKPTDVWKDAAKKARELSGEGKLVSLMLSVEGADTKILQEFSTRPVLRLDGLNFSEFFVWLSASLAEVTRQEVVLPDTKSKSWDLILDPAGTGDGRFSKQKRNTVEVVKVYDPQGKPQILGEFIGKGKEGRVYRLQGRPEVVVKIYGPETFIKRDKALPEKVMAMCELGEKDNRFLGEDRRLAWPIFSVYNSKNEWIGYAMYLAKEYAMKKLVQNHDLDRRKVVEWLLNLLDITIILHKRGVMIGDYNLNNFMFDPESDAITLIDCDSFQAKVRDKTLPCHVGRPEMTAKELHGKDYSKVKRTEQSEAFSIAIVMFIALMRGKHPYDRVGGSSQAKNTYEGIFPYGIGENGKDIPVGSWYTYWSHLPDYVKELFIRTFDKDMGANNPECRATLKEWVEALKTYRNEIDEGLHEVAYGSCFSPLNCNQTRSTMTLAGINEVVICKDSR